MTELDDAAGREAIRIVNGGAQILLPFGVESGPVGVRFPDRVELAKRIAVAIRKGAAK